ncbi:MAG TPA: multicopper oxidase domain-containing protein [Thermoleophilaceae bacterium]|nr:multicopper oxidase domain-containing protein [Thermoleophilaceae bacterium]
MAARRIARALAVAGALALSAAAPAAARTRDVWVAAVRTSWNAVPNGHDAISGMHVPPEDAIFPTVVYRRYSEDWKRPLPNAKRSNGDGLLIPGPLIRARVGDRLRIHFKNMDTLRRDPHSMHFHGVHYKPSSDGAFVPGFSGRDGNVRFGKSYTYKLRAGRDSAGVWPYHDHSPSMMDSIDGGMFGMLSILDRHERAPDREFQVVFSPFGKDFMAINGRAFVGNTPVYRSKVGETVQWDVMAMGSDHHTFHVHGHRWMTPGRIPRDTQTVGPAESFKIRWKERDPGTWLYHCHVEDHMMRGMIGLYRVARK